MGPKSTNYPDHGHHGDLPLLGKIPMVEPGIEPRTSWLVVRNPDNQTTKLVTHFKWRRERSPTLRYIDSVYIYVFLYTSLMMTHTQGWN